MNLEESEYPKNFSDRDEEDLSDDEVFSFLVRAADQVLSKSVLELDDEWQKELALE